MLAQASAWQPPDAAARVAEDLTWETRRMPARQAPEPASVCLLDSSYGAEAASLLYRAYRNGATFRWLMDSGRPGYEHRLRTTLRELLRNHIAEQRPALGLVQNDRLIGIALVSPPERRLEVTESWGWRWRMLLSAGRRATRRYLDFHAAVMACVPPGPHHLLPLFGVLPEYQGQGYGEQLLAALHDWCAQDPTSHGIVLDTGNHRYMAFYRRNGYQEIGEVHLGPVREHVFFHPNPQPLAGIPGSRG